MLPTGKLITVELAWCPECRMECTVEIVALPGDPTPVAICLDCSGGVETEWQPAGRASVPVAEHARRAS